MDLFNNYQNAHNLLNIYRNAILGFEKYLEIIYSDTCSIANHRGYLINLDDYKKIKKIVLDNKAKFNPTNIFKINQIEIKTPSYLINSILKKNQYIFINNDLWQIICDKNKNNESYIIYTIYLNDLIFSLDNQKLYFKADKNIININTINYKLIYNKNIEQIKQIRDGSIIYDIFEDKISKDLKSKNFWINKAFLVNKTWINKWKEYSNYNIINNNLQDILNNIIYFFELKKIINEMNILKFNKKKDFEMYLDNDSLTLIDSNCIRYLNNDFSQKYIIYSAFNNKIHIYLENNEILTFKSNNNTISLNGIINYPIHLKQLIKLFYFQKNFNEILLHKSFLSRSYCTKDIYLISKNIINKYKNNFKYQKLKDLLESNQNTKNINYLDLQEYYPIIINELGDDYINQIEQIEVFDKFKEFNDFVELEYKINPSSKINFKYINNFEIIDENIKNFFIKHNIAKDDHFISCSYIADNGKILIIFKKNNKNFYEIGHFNKNEDFIIEILIDELKRENKLHIIKYFLKNGIDNFIKNYAKEPQKMITFEVRSQLQQSYFFYLLKIEFIYCKIEVNQLKKLLNSPKSNNKTINNNDDIKDNKYIKDIFSILLSIFTFEKKLKNSIDKSNKENSLPFQNIVLLSSNFVNDFKNCVLFFDKIVSFLEKINIDQDYNYEEVLYKFYKDEKGKEYYNLILNNEKKIEKYNVENKEYFFFEKKEFMTSSKQENIYPDKFYISDNNIFSKIMNKLNKNFESEEISFDLFFKHGKIALKPNKDSIFNKYNNNYSLFLYSLRKENNSNEINFIPEIKLLFEKNENRFNFLKEIINNNTEVFSYNNLILEEKYEFRSYLINENKAIEPMKNQMKEFSLNNKVNKYLSYLIIIYNENTKIKNELYLQSIAQEKEFYLINRKYMNQLENIIFFKEFINNRNIDTIKNLDLDINYYNNEIENNLKDVFKDFTTNYLLKIDENKLIFDNENIYNISKKEFVNKEKIKLYYYDDCQIINQKLYLLLNQIDKNLLTKVQLINPILNDNKIFFSFNSNIINIETLNENNNTLIMEDIIYSESSEELLNIREIFKTAGYLGMKNYLNNKKIDIIFNSYSSHINIYSLSRKKETYKNEKYLSSKLKTLILLSLFEKNSTKYYKRNKTEKVFLMNKDWLIHYQYDKIKSLIEKIEVNNYINNQNQLNLSIDSNQMNDIISLLDNEELLKIDEYISKLQEYNNIPCEAKSEKLKLKDNKIIFIYNNFFMINKEFTHIFNLYFSEFFNCNNITYVSHAKGDIIIIDKFQQYSLFFGKISYKNFAFDIEFIFDFNDSYHLEKECINLLNKEIIEYIQEKTIFNDNNILNIISPIFENDGIIGYCYKYSSKSNNKYDIDCFDYLSNDNLLKAIKLYFFYREFSEKIKEIKYNKNEYYLININLMSEIKINYKYKQIKEILDTINFSDKNKKYILSIKRLPNDIITYFKENTIKKEYEKELIEPDIIPIKDIKEKEKSFMIYDKFEILEKEMVQNLFDEVYRFENNCLKCEINEGKIIILYPSNFSGNDKNISVIGQLNYENHFLIEYILIYNDDISQICHSLNIKGNLESYLSSLQLYENSAPIVDENFKELGTIIKYSNEISNYISDNLLIKEKEKKEIINDINNNSNKESLYSFNEKNENDKKIDEGVVFDEPNNNEIDEYNLDYKTDSPEIKVNFIRSPKIGLQNIGATCYMNATLQCFCHIEKFVNFIKYSQQVITIVKKDKNNLTSSFKLLIEKLWPNNYYESYPQKYYEPEEFKNKISKLNPLFEGIAANDAKDLVNFIIMKLHQELNKAKKGNTACNIILKKAIQLVI